jgi:hypothetical protein
VKTEKLNELKAIYDDEGLLKPETFVERASNPESAWHNDFVWDNEKAGHQFRLHQARQFIRVAVAIDPTLEEPIKVRVFTSLKSDRKNPGGGYRSMQDVLSHDGMRQELLQQALAEFKSARDKYKEVKELADVFASVDAAVERHRPAIQPEQRASA